MKPGDVALIPWRRLAEICLDYKYYLTCVGWEDSEEGN